MATQTANLDQEDRPMKKALIRGALGHCPACGQGKLFSSYLKVQPKCTQCGEEFFHHRADDGPAYLTVSIMANVVIGIMMMIFVMYRPSPMAMILGLSLFSIIGCLVLLPPTKGGFIAFQWARRMHGFDKHPVLDAAKHLD